LATFTFAFDSLLCKPAFNVASSCGGFEAGNHRDQIAASQPYADSLGDQGPQVQPGVQALAPLPTHSKKLRQFINIDRDSLRLILAGQLGPAEAPFSDGHHRINDKRIRLCVRGKLGAPPMKMLLAGITFALVMAFTSQAFAADLPDCPKGAWKHGHYVCGDIQANS
jgi:hypothetical protein